MANQARILLFNMNNDRQRSIERLCRSLSIKTSYIRSTSYHDTLGYLTGIQGFPKKPVSPSASPATSELESEMLVFSGMDSDATDAFLAAFKNAGLPPIALKAVLTPTNVFWTPIKLYEELCKEHKHLHINMSH